MNNVFDMNGMKLNRAIVDGIDHAELVVSRILASKVDITGSYDIWMRIAFSLANLGEQGRDLFLLVSSLNPGYDREECSKKFDHALKERNGLISLGTFFDIAKRHNIDISKPKGRPRQSAEEKDERKKNKMEQARDYLLSNFEFRYNVWNNHIEILDGAVWRMLEDRDRSNFYCRMQIDNVSITEIGLTNLLQFEEVVPKYDMVSEWLDSLPEWHPAEQDDIAKESFACDPIRDFFEHIVFRDDENHDFYIHMMRKWFVGLVAMMMDAMDEHNLVLVLTGKQHVGKTYFLRHILPPELKELLYSPNPSARVDKDFVISLSENLLFLLDEFSFEHNAKSEAYKYIVTSADSKERDSYAHYRISRKRRAAICATTNQQHYILDRQGNRRFLSVKVHGYKDFSTCPLDYIGAYSMAKYLLEHGYDPKPSRDESASISKHNEDFMAYTDAEAVIRSYCRLPLDKESGQAISAAELSSRLKYFGFQGSGFSANALGRALSELGYEYRTIHGTRKYFIIVKDLQEVFDESVQDAVEFRKSQSNDNDAPLEYDDSIPWYQD